MRGEEGVGASVKLDEIVRWRGRRCFLRGYSRMSSADTQYVHREEVETGERFTVALDEGEPEHLHAVDEPPKGSR